MKFSQRGKNSHTEDGGSSILRNVGNHLCDYTEIQATIQQFKIVNLEVLFVCVIYLTFLPVIPIVSMTSLMYSIMCTISACQFPSDSVSENYADLHI